MSIGHHLDELRVLEQEQSQELVNGHLPPEKQEDEQTTIKRRVAAILKMRHDRMRDAKVSLLSPLFTPLTVPLRLLYSPGLSSSLSVTYILYTYTYLTLPLIMSLIFSCSLTLPLCHLYFLLPYPPHPLCPHPSYLTPHPFYLLIPYTP